MNFTTKAGNNIELKKEITGGEYQDIQDVLLEDTKVGDDQKVKMGTKAIAKMRDRSIQVIVLSVNGAKENILEKVRALPVEDYKEVLDKVNEIRDGLNAEKKTQ